MSSIFLETAFRIGIRICRDAFWSKARCNWIGGTLEEVYGKMHPVQKMLGPDVYGGTTGIALFLARLYRSCQDEVLLKTCRGAVKHALSRLEDVDPQRDAGFYSGHPGIAYALIEIGETLKEPDWLKAGLELIQRRARVALTTQHLDITIGAAGTLVGLLSAYRKHPGEQLLEQATELGCYLIQVARRSERGLSWPFYHDSGHPPSVADLTGLSHGAAGISWALLELWAISGLSQFRQAATDGFRYEQSWYSPEHQNWPDLRQRPATPNSTPAEPSYVVAWCHGAAGIGLSRLRALALTGDEQYHRDTEAAIATTTRMLKESLASQENFSLCHGLAGNAELLLDAASMLCRPQYLEMAKEVGMHGIRRYEARGVPWPSGTQGNNPGLLVGDAGIGHFFLRLHDPAVNASLLLMCPAQAPTPANNQALGS